MRRVRAKVSPRIFVVLAGAIVVTCVAGPGSTVFAEGGAAALSGPETKLQGTWKAKSGWVLVFDGRTFSAKSGTEWFQGSFTAPATDDDPARLDLDIEDCASCAYKGMTSKSIYRWEEKGLLLSGASPGKSRPPIFDDTMGLVLEMTRVTEPKKP